ncbi:VWA domain-containing protein [Vulgatibacter incomptus]|uniref:BatB n=1 Tax=Vulgatibacter incomptus TaxID=1391653 RepID=A0A0K1P8Y1_9BACT|nr:VWA domain-containing protein [Vulgatibacter incomptus]AKU89988.1 BatB [Vulgatibacter incomptus]
MSIDPIDLHLLGESLRIARPDRAWLVAAVLACALVGAWGIVARRRALRELAGTERLAAKLGGGVSVGRMIAKAALGSLGLLALSLALLRPQLGEKADVAHRRGIDLVVAVDASRSMLARDVLPSRIERAKLELQTLIDRLQGDRVGLVTFAGDAFVQCPLTTDYGAAKLFLRAIDPEAMPSQGTALAEALRTAGSMFRAADRGAASKVVLLLTDGEDHQGEAQAAAEALANDGVRIFALGIGSDQGTPVPILDSRGKIVGYRKDHQGNTVMSKLDDGQLRALAAATKGTYVAAAGADLGMGELVAALHKLERSELDAVSGFQYGEAFSYLALPGFLFLVAGALLRERGRDE